MICFWDTVVYVMQAKYKINKIYVIKVKNKLLVITNLSLIYHYFHILNSL